MSQQLRLIIADDESIIRMGLRETLQGLGYLVAGEASDGQGAVHLARELRPDLVIMDIRMPKMDGISAAKIIASEQLAPVLLLTAFVDHDQVSQACEAGVMSYLIKPFRDSDLTPAIELAVARYAARVDKGKQIHELNDQLETRKLVGRAKGVLMDSHGLKEQEAFRKIQQLAMNTRKPMREVAQAILLAAQIDK